MDGIESTTPRSLTALQLRGCVRWHLCLHSVDECRQSISNFNDSEEFCSQILGSVSHSVPFDSLWPNWRWPARLLCPWNSQARILEWVGNHSLLQELSQTQGLNLGPLHCRWVPYHLSLGSPGGSDGTTLPQLTVVVVFLTRSGKFLLMRA